MGNNNFNVVYIFEEGDYKVVEVSLFWLVQLNDWILCV